MEKSLEKSLIIIVLLIIVIFGIGAFSLGLYPNVKQLQTSHIKKPVSAGGMIELTGNFISLDVNSRVIQIYSKKLNKNIVLTYNGNTLFYIHEILTNKQYQQALDNHKKELIESQKKIQELRAKNQSSGIAVSAHFPPVSQNFFREFKSINGLALKKDDIITVNFKNLPGQPLLLDLIKSK